MKAPGSLWYETKPRGRGAVIDVILRRCPNCGEIKVLSNPCGLDHLAALLEFKDAAKPVVEQFSGNFDVRHPPAQSTPTDAGERP